MNPLSGSPLHRNNSVSKVKCEFTLNYNHKFMLDEKLFINRGKRLPNVYLTAECAARSNNNNQSWTTLFQLYQQYKNYTFYQQGVLHNTLVDTTFVKVLIQPTRDQLFAIIKQMGLEYPQINRAADLFSYVPKQFFDLLSKSDLTEANLLFQELENFHGPWRELSNKKTICFIFC